METPPPETRDQQPKKMKVDKRDRSVKECYLEEFGIVDIDGVAVCVICKTVENATAVSRILGSEAEMRENEQDAASISLISNFYRCLRKKYTFKYPPVRLYFNSSLKLPESTLIASYVTV